MNGRPQTNTNRVTNPTSPYQLLVRQHNDEDEGDRRKIVGSMLETAVSSIALGVQSANRSLRKDISLLVKLIGWMAFIIGVLLTMVLYAYIFRA